MAELPALTLERGLPASPDAERSILGAILLDNDHLYEAGQHNLAAEDFSLESHRRVYARMAELARAGRSIDLVTLVEHLAMSKEVESIGGAAYIASLTEGLPRRVSIEDYVRIVREKAMLRGVIRVCSLAGQSAADQSEEAQGIISRADQELLGLIAQQDDIPGIEEQTARELDIFNRQIRGEQAIYLPTGLAPLDMQIGGIGIGEFTVLAARPGQGKTSFLVDLIERFCLRGEYCHFFSVEMRAGELLRRLWSKHSGVRYRRIRRGMMTGEEANRVRASALEIATWPLTIDDKARLTLEQLIARGRVSKRKHNTRFYALDYLQKLRFTKDLKFRHMDISDAALGIAAFAKEERAGFLCVSSLSRVEKKLASGRPPTLEDLKGSGDIEFEAHTVLFMHRELDEETQKLKPGGKFIVAKSRAEEQGSVDFDFDPVTLSIVAAPGQQSYLDD